MRDHMDGFRDALVNWAAPPFPHPIGDWDRPRTPDVDPDKDELFSDPPFVNIRLFPSAGVFDGTLNDPQADVRIRFQIQAVGLSQTQAIQLLDLTRPPYADFRNTITIPNRYVQYVKLLVGAGGVSRDDDLPSPFFYDFDLYEMWTTPA